MNNVKPITNLLKGISLLILDVITFILVFSIWTIVDYDLFPWAFIAILIALIFINVDVMFAANIKSMLGIGAYTSITVATCLYYGSIILYTGVIYEDASQSGYVITALIITLIYVAVITGLYLSGANSSVDRVRQDKEQGQVLNVTMQILNIQDAIKNSSSYLDQNKYDAIVTNFDEMKERLAFSTPFGRISKPVIMEMEAKLNSKLLILNDEISTLGNKSDMQIKYDSIMNSITDIKSLTINREKLIIQ